MKTTINNTISVLETLTNKVISIKQKTNEFLTETMYEQLDLKINQLSALFNKIPIEEDDNIIETNNPYFYVSNCPDSNYNGNYYDTGIIITNAANNMIFNVYKSNNNKYIVFEIQMYSYVIADEFDINKNSYGYYSSGIKYYIATDTIYKSRILSDPNDSSETTGIITVINAQELGIRRSIYVYKINNSSNSDINGKYLKTEYLNNENQIIYQNEYNYKLSFYPSIPCWKLENINQELIGISSTTNIYSKFDDMTGDGSGDILVTDYVE